MPPERTKVMNMPPESNNNQITELWQKIDKLEVRIEILENNQPKNHTHSTNAAIEDSLAVAADILISEDQQREYASARINQLVKILQQVKKSPYSYDPDRPAGERPKNGNQP